MLLELARFKSPGRLLATALLISGVSVATAQQDADVSHKGIFLSDEEDRKTAVEFNVLLNRDGRQRIVESNHRFQDDDRMRFQFKLNRDSYVYVLHRTIDGDPRSDRVRRYAGPKGIEVVRDENRRRGSPGDRDRERSAGEDGSYQLLFPNKTVGMDNRLRAHTVHTVPVDRNLFFTMDDNPGIEKLYLVVSDKQLDIGEHFDIEDGRSRRRSGSGSGRRDDSASDVLDQLIEKLAAYGGNSSVSFATKGIGVESYGVVLERDKPMMVEVDLAHHRK